MPRNKLEAKIGDRWAILGATGSGKTVLSREILKMFAIGTDFSVPIFIIDSKRQGDFKVFENPKWGKVIEGDTPPKAILDTKGVPFLIWKPDTDNIDMYDRFFENVYLAGRKHGAPAIIYIDELGSLTNAQGSKFPLHYDRLLKQGRGMNIGLISVTQSPAFIPANLLRQTTHIVRMHLNAEYDVKKISKQMGSVAEEEPYDDYGFFYRNCTKPIKKSPAIYYEDFREFLGIDAA